MTSDLRETAGVHREHAAVRVDVCKLSVFEERWCLIFNAADV